MKKMLVLVLAALLVLSFIACGGTSADKEAPQSSGQGLSDNESRVNQPSQPDTVEEDSIGLAAEYECGTFNPYEPEPFTVEHTEQGYRVLFREHTSEYAQLEAEQENGEYVLNAPLAQPDGEVYFNLHFNPDIKSISFILYDHREGGEELYGSAYLPTSPAGDTDDSTSQTEDDYDYEAEKLLWENRNKYEGYYQYVDKEGRECTLEIYALGNDGLVANNIGGFHLFVDEGILWADIEDDNKVTVDYYDGAYTLTLEWSEDKNTLTFQEYGNSTKEIHWQGVGTKTEIAD